jgi:pyruvate dehydrogenase E2 component (dihydrolipoamide acetyltransferase)
MPMDVTLPKLAEGGATGTVARILVAPGDRVAKDDPLLELETEKAVVEVPSPAAGVVKRILVEPGQELAEGAPLLVLDTAGETPPAEEPPAPTLAPEPAPTPTPAPTPEPAPTAAAPTEASRAAAPAPPAEPSPLPTPTARALVPAAPSVRRLARELGVDIALVPGTGPGGRISAEDVKAYVKSRLGAPAAAAPTFEGLTLPDLARFGPVERRPLSQVRKATAAHLGRSWPLVPQVTHHDLADVTELEAARRAHAARVEALGGKLTMTAILLKVAAVVLRRHEKFRTSLDLAAGELVVKDYVHIGVAVDTPRGLLVPVLRDVDRKSIVELAVELKEVSERARQGKLKPEEMQGGVFSISNLGGIGGTSFTPIVNWPEVAILGVSRTRVEPRWQDGTVVPRTVLPLSLSYDHRVIDGAEAARFVRDLVDHLESPFRLALEA